MDKFITSIEGMAISFLSKEDAYRSTYNFFVMRLDEQEFGWVDVEIRDLSYDSGAGHQSFVVIIHLPDNKKMGWRVHYVPYVNEKIDVNDGIMLQAFEPIAVY